MSADVLRVLVGVMALTWLAWLTACWLPRRARLPMTEREKWWPVLRDLSGAAFMALFAGMMLAIAAGVLLPRIALVATPIVCDGQVRIESQSYVLPPNQHGTVRHAWCTQADGVQKEVTTRLLVGATVIHAGVVMMVFQWLRLWALLRQRLFPSSWGSTP